MEVLYLYERVGIEPRAIVRCPAVSVGVIPIQILAIISKCRLSGIRSQQTLTLAAPMHGVFPCTVYDNETAANTLCICTA